MGWDYKSERDGYSDETPDYSESHDYSEDNPDYSDMSNANNNPAQKSSNNPSEKRYNQTQQFLNNAEKIENRGKKTEQGAITRLVCERKSPSQKHCNIYNNMHSKHTFKLHFF